ncbi:MAG: hypothetical protein H7839_10055 [Magnetococcus sp. YQC-5]
MHISQDGVSRIEKRSDLLISTLSSYVEAMGGKRHLVAEFPNSNPVMLSSINSLVTHKKNVASQTNTPSLGLVIGLLFTAKIIDILALPVGERKQISMIA